MSSLLIVLGTFVLALWSLAHLSSQLQFDIADYHPWFHDDNYKWHVDEWCMQEMAAHSEYLQALAAHGMDNSSTIFFRAALGYTPDNLCDMFGAYKARHSIMSELPQVPVLWGTMFLPEIHRQTCFGSRTARRAS